MPLPAWRSSGSSSSRRSRAFSSLPATAGFRAAWRMGRGQPNECASWAHRQKVAQSAVAAVPRWASAVCNDVLGSADDTSSAMRLAELLDACAKLCASCPCRLCPQVWRQT